MRVVVTRPAHSGKRTAERLRRMGHDPILLPLTHPVHHTREAMEALAGSSGAIAVTSAEAIEALCEQAVHLAPYLDRPVFAVGQTTADKATQTGFRNVLHSDADGKALAELISASRSLLEGQPLLYLAGAPRAPGFETSLADLSIPFRTVEAYRMEPLPQTEAALSRIFSSARVDTLLLYSRHAATLLFALPFLQANGSLLAQTRLLCLSKSVASAIPTLFAANVQIAASPDENNLLLLLG